ncbi:MAG: hypothetical protein H7Y19_11680 [Luteimonas sp.]|nr:hypothetical protein [Luteimonas sp.]
MHPSMILRPVPAHMQRTCVSPRREKSAAEHSSHRAPDDVAEVHGMTTNKSEAEVTALEAALPYLKKVLPPAEVEEQVQEFARDILNGAPVEDRQETSRRLDEVVRDAVPPEDGTP